MTTNEIVRLEKIIAELRKEMREMEDRSEKSALMLATELDNANAQVRGLTTRYEHHAHHVELMPNGTDGVSDEIYETVIQQVKE